MPLGAVKVLLVGGRPGRGEAPSQVVAVRFTPEELAKLDARAEARHVTRSALIREAALAGASVSTLSQSAPARDTSFWGILMTALFL